MHVYICKNNQQSGPFEEWVVIEKLKTGHLSPYDMAFKSGESEWSTLGKLFPKAAWANNLPTKTQVQTPQTKSGSSKGVLFALLGLGGLFLIGVIGLAGIFIIYKTTTNSKTETKNKTGNFNTNSTNPNTKKPDFNALKLKAEELAAMSPPLRLDPNATIKGKVAVVEKDQYGASVKGFYYSENKYMDSEIESYGLSKQRMATNPGEIDTLIQVVCRKGKYVGRYEGGITAYANDCKVSIIDYRTPAVIAQQTFTNDKPEKSISSTYDGGEYILLKPNGVEEYAASFPLEKLKSPATDLPFDDDNGRYGKYKPFMDTASELSRVLVPVNLDANATIKGKVAIVIQDADGRSEIKGFDVYGKEFMKYEHEGYGFTSDKLAVKTDEIETLIRTKCTKGSKLGSVRGTNVFSNRCEVSIIDFKSSTVIAQQTFENKEIYRDFDTDVYPTEYVDIAPSSEIEAFVKSLPKT